MPSKHRREGYLLVDHRASIGLSETDAISAGLDPKLARGGSLYESATYTCSHCQSVIVMNPQRTRARGYCPSCDKYVCDTCEHARKTLGCRTFERIIEETQEAAVRGQFVCA